MADTSSFRPSEVNVVRRHDQVHVSLVAIPDAVVSTLGNLYDVFTLFETLVPGSTRFAVEIVGIHDRPVTTASGLPFAVHRSIETPSESDIVIVPSLLLHELNWQTGRYPQLVRWLADQYARGAVVCSACSGVLLLAETGLLNGCEATVHWAYARTFENNFPQVRLRVEKVLVMTGQDNRLIMSGASASWHDLALTLITRYAGPAAAQAIAKFFLLQWHAEGQAPYVMFREVLNHGDSMVLSAQGWLRDHWREANPVERMAQVSGLPERSFKRRFHKATGYAPLAYVQQLRTERAKQLLETSDMPVDAVSWEIGYEDAAFFRRLFRRLTGLTPSAYRRKFRFPGYVAPVADSWVSPYRARKVSTRRQVAKDISD